MMAGQVDGVSADEATAVATLNALKRFALERPTVYSRRTTRISGTPVEPPHRPSRRCRAGGNGHQSMTEFDSRVSMGGDTECYLDSAMNWQDTGCKCARHPRVPRTARERSRQ